MFGFPVSTIFTAHGSLKIKGSWDMLRGSVSQELYVMDIHGQSVNLSSAEFVSDSITEVICIETLAWLRGCCEMCTFKYL